MIQETPILLSGFFRAIDYAWHYALMVAVQYFAHSEALVPSTTHGLFVGSALNSKTPIAIYVDPVDDPWGFNVLISLRPWQEAMKTSPANKSAACADQNNFDLSPYIWDSQVWWFITFFHSTPL